MTTQILIRADGSKQIGMGHLYRCALIAKKLMELGWKVMMVSKDYPQAVDFLNKLQLPALFLKQGQSWSSETDEFAGILGSSGCQAVILDLLDGDTDESFTSMIRDNGRRLICLTDDSFRRVIDADIIINANPNQLEIDYEREAGRYLLGPKYFIMDEVFRSTRVVRPHGGLLRHILLTFGGSDHNDLLFRILGIFEKLKSGVHLVVISSQFTGYLPRLKQLAESTALDIELHCDVPYLAPYLERCDGAITAGGNTLFERIATRLPGATICQLVRQNEMAEKFQQLGVNTNFGYFSDVSDEQLAEGVRHFIMDENEHLRQYETSPQIIDGSGLSRSIEAITNLLEETT